MLSRVDWEEEILSLFAITYQLRTLTTKAAFNISEVLRQTTLAQHCAKLLSIWTESKEIYFLQLEAFWILTNLARGDESDVALLLSDDLPGYNLSLNLLGITNSYLRKLQNDDMQDLKMFTQICWFIGNLVFTSDDIAKEVQQETAMIECCLMLLDKNQVLHPSVLEKLYWALVKFNLPGLPQD